MIAHRVYLWLQKRQSRAKRFKDPGFRTKRYISELQGWLRKPWPEPVLCLGPRNYLELAYLRQAGCQDVVGLDLFSSAANIKVGDMHAMPFADETFGFVWASHVLEHARDIDRVMSEIRRVLRPGGVLFFAYPTGFETNWHDRHDLGRPEFNPLFHGLVYSHYTKIGQSSEWSGLVRR